MTHASPLSVTRVAASCDGTEPFQRLLGRLVSQVNYRMNNDRSPASVQLNIYCNAPFPEPVMAGLRRALEPHCLISYNTELAASSLAEADITVGQPDPRLIIQSTRLRWVHLTTAGYTRYDNASFRNHLASRGGILTNSSSVFDEPCAQHVLGMMMALARRLPQAWADQNGPRDWPQSLLRGNARLLNGQTAVIFGYGAIAGRLSELLAPLRMNLIGVRRSPRGDEPIRMVSTDAADEWLGRADHVVNILPGSADTQDYFDSGRIAAIKTGAIFYNIGRGSTVDQTALQSALRTRRLAAAYLDVAEPEPLPPTHPLWLAPNCYITPHAAGGHADETERLAQLFLANFRRFTSGEPLSDRII
jgi:phosphoglycerate dehydrogenase-like enzyme